MNILLIFGCDAIGADRSEKGSWASPCDANAFHPNVINKKMPSGKNMAASRFEQNRRRDEIFGRKIATALEPFKMRKKSEENRKFREIH